MTIAEQDKRDNRLDSEQRKSDKIALIYDYPNNDTLTTK